MKDNNKYPHAERRNSERLKVDFSLFYRTNKPWDVFLFIGGKEVEAMALDLSSGGIAISTNYNIHVATVLSMKIMIYKQRKENNFKLYKTINAKGKVCSNILEDANRYRIGINFDEIDIEDKEELLKFAKKEPGSLT